MNVLMLCYRGEPMREFALGPAAVEVGCAPGCDIVVHDPDVRERHALVQARSGTVDRARARGRRAAGRLRHARAERAARHRALALAGAPWRVRRRRPGRGPSRARAPDPRCSGPVRAGTPAARRRAVQWISIDRTVIRYRLVVSIAAPTAAP
ncbi:MAG: FHA domain-containing protein, partial [Sandaracinaceae bacterium]|nr:FHA domain-containing protein [Sandaracinaceae bacterium]